MVRIYLFLIMPPKKSKSTLNEMALKDISSNELSTALLSALENDIVITKLATVLLISMNLLLEEKMTPMLTRLDIIASEMKTIHTRMLNLEQDNSKLKQMNGGLQGSVTGLTAKVNQLKQTSRKCSVVITGVKETYAKRTSEAVSEDGEQSDTLTREDTVKTVCKVLKDACKVDAEPSYIQPAVRLYSKAKGPRPLLVTFHSTSLLSFVVMAHRPKQTLIYDGASMYVNNHLIRYNTDLFFKTRLLVKKKMAHSTWVRDGRILIIWSVNSRPVAIFSVSDLD